MDSRKQLLATAIRLESDAKKLREAADILSHGSKIEPEPYNGTRAEQLAAFIAKHNGSGASRTEILAESGIPTGTVASLLGSGKRFHKDANGHWHVRKSSKSAEQEAAPVHV